MSEDPTTSSLGDPNAQPPTPRHTPTSASFPDPAFETPKHRHNSFEELSSWTPRFAEEYSVFNSTPGNLRGSHGAFLDFSVTTPYQGHKRQHSESLGAQIATHVNHFSPNPNLPLPPVDPSQRLQSSPDPSITGRSPTNSDFQVTSQQGPSKRVCRGTLREGQVQTATPPPSAHKGARRLAPKLQTDTMQNEEYEEFVAGTPQQQPMQHFVQTPIGMYGCPLSAPATAPAFTDSGHFWNGMSTMDFDFAAAGGNMFQAANHRPMASLDWGKSNDVFQETGVVPPPQVHDNNPPQRKERVLAPKPPMPNVDTSMSDASMFGQSFSAPMDQAFAMMNPGSGVNPGLLFTQPPSSGMEMAIFDPMSQSHLMQSWPAPELLPVGAEKVKRSQIRRSGSTKETGKGKKINRASASSPVKTSVRPGLSRSVSENRGRNPTGRASNLPTLAPAARPNPQLGSGRSVSQGSKANGRSSPLKNHHRLTSLTSIPETTAPRTRTSVKFTIDSRGRAHAETTVIVGDDEHTPKAVRSQDNRSPRKHWESSEDDDSSTDEEPIIIPSRNTSFAMPEPRRAALARALDSSQRSFSEQSTGSLGIFFNEPVSSQNDAESEAETVLNVPTRGSRGDAASELRKVREDRQKRVSALNTNQRFTSVPPYSANSTVSPTTLTHISIPTPSTDRGNQIRCVCNTTDSHINGDGYMVQCESCEMFLHGKCVNITRQTLPRVYICAFCANTPNAHGMRGREVRRNMGGSNPRASATSPLARKSFKSFR